MLFECVGSVASWLKLNRFASRGMDADLDLLSDVLAVAAAADSTARPAAPRPLPAPEVRPRRFSFGRPSERTPEQHYALAARMRESKAKHAVKRKADSHAASMVSFAQDIKESGISAPNIELCVRPSKRGKHFGEEFAIVRAQTRAGRALHWRFSPASMIQIAQDSVTKGEVLAQKYGSTRATIRTVQVIVASMFLKMQTKLLAMLASIFQACMVFWGCVYRDTKNLF